MLFLMFPAPCTDLVHLAATIGTIHHAGECGHFTHRSESASAITEWRKIAVLLTVTVDPVIDGNKADIRFREHHLGIVTDL